MKCLKYGLILFSAFMFFSCSTTRTLSEGELLYKGADVQITDKKFLRATGIKNNLKKQVRPEPNKKFLGLIPIRLLIYNAYSDTADLKKTGRWIRNKLGEEPVVLSDNFIQQSEKDMLNYLFGKGYFEAATDHEIKTRRRKAAVEYFVRLNERYALDTVQFPEPLDSLTRYISLSETNTLLKKGDGYDIEVLRDERERIKNYLRTKGFYYYNADHLIFKIDSNGKEKNVFVSLEVKPDISLQARQQYYIGEVYVHADHSLMSDMIQVDTMLHDSIHIIYKENDIRHRLLSKSVLLSPNTLFNYEKYEATLNKLSGLGIYKYSNIRFSQPESNGNLLKTDIFLTKAIPKTIRVELTTVTKSNAYAGPGVTINFSNKNAFRGAELLSLNLNGSFETQFARGRRGGNTYDIGGDIQVTIPRFLNLIYDFNRILSRKYTPQTRISASYIFTYNALYFRMNTFDVNFGYKWQETPTRRHEIQLISANFSRITDRSPVFDSLLASDALIRESFNERLNLSLKYSYIYSDQIYIARRVNNYFNLNLQFAGNQIDLLNRLFNSSYSESSVNNRFLGIPYSQFAKISVDYRFYLNLGQYRKLVSRWFAGIGMPYSNSRVLPYSVQFYSGGVTSIRAFQPRTLGPGSYTPDSSVTANNYLGQAGDIKLESNLEYRFTIYRLVKGAFFLDVGNIWLINSEDENKAGGVFRFNRFIEELAVGSGFGLRFDAGIFVLRFDLGTPLKRPDRSRWTFSEINLLSGSWYFNNVVLGVAIGYPF